MEQTETTIKQSFALEKAQRYTDALKLVDEARRKDPSNRSLGIRLAQLLETTKQFPQALFLYRQLAQGKPQSPEAEVVLGMARCQLRSAQYEQAAGLLSQIREKLPNDPGVLTGLASCRRHKGAVNEAEKLTRQALEADADFKPAIHELAEIQLAGKEDDLAVATLERNVLREDLYGDSLDLWLNTLKRLKRDRYTQEKLAAMVKKYPDRVEFIFGVGVLAHRAGEISIARPALKKADQLSPNNYRILHELGVMERTAGNVELSQELIGRSLALNPEQPAGLRTYGNEHKYAYGDAEFTRLNFAAARLADVPAIDQVHLHYALGKAFEDVSELDTAFRHYAIAGEKKRRLEPYSERDSARMFRLLPQLVNAKTLAEGRQPGCESELPVFILGMPRSGTSLLEQILSSHPDVFGAGELKYMTGVLDNIQVGPQRVILNDAEPFFAQGDNVSWEVRGQRYVDKLERLADRPCKRIIDKMPGNFTMVGLIHAIMPKARILHSRRDPIETCLSNYRIHYAEGQLWSYNLREMGRYYKRYWELMKHWREQFPGVMYEVCYEDIVADVEGQAHKLIEYLGLPWNDACLEFYNTDRPVKTASASQVRRPIYSTSVNRWKKYEKYLQPLLHELGDIPEQYEKMLKVKQK